MFIAISDFDGPWKFVINMFYCISIYFQLEEGPEVQPCTGLPGWSETCIDKVG